MDVLDSVLIAVAALYGALIGSFLNVVILRLPKEGASIVFPSSHCPICKQAIRWYDNIPIFSYLILRGKCRSCHTHISLQYPLVELLTAVLAGGLCYRFGFGFDLLYFFIFCAALVVIIFIDIHHQIIPDRISLPGIALGFGGSFFSNQVTWLESLLGLLIGGGLLYAIALVYQLLKKREGMGGGDIKLLAMIGAFLGWQSLLYVVFISSLTGSVVGVWAMIRQKQGGLSRLPFGPFLAFGALTWLFFHPQIMGLWHWYLEMIGYFSPIAG